MNTYNARIGAFEGCLAGRVRVEEAARKRQERQSSRKFVRVVHNTSFRACTRASSKQVSNSVDHAYCTIMLRARIKGPGANERVCVIDNDKQKASMKRKNGSTAGVPNSSNGSVIS